MADHLKALSENPDLTAEYTVEQVAEARAELAEFIAGVKAGEIEADSEAIAEAKSIAEKLTERETALEAEMEARQAEILALEEALGPGDGDDSEDDDEAEAVVEEVPVVEVPDTAEEILEEESVTASAKPTTGKLAARIPEARRPRAESSGPALVASAANYAGRDLLTASALGEMIQKASRGLPDVASSTRFTMASLSTEGQHKYSVKPGDNDGNAAALAAVARDAADNGALVASGGFCAPAETLYGFFNLATRAGILNLPTVNAPRGSVSLPVSPTFADFFGESGIATEWTNINDITPTSPATKPVYEFVCPEFQDCEVSAWPTILQFGNFASRFYPEAIANATGLAMIAADRTVNAARINFLRTGAGNGVEAPNTAGSSGIWNVARVLSQNAAFYRQTYAMSPDAVLDAAIPYWVPDALYIDALGRGATVDYQDMSRRIAGIFSEINVRPQFVYDLDDTATAGFPGTADMLLWAPGTVVELDGGTLDLGVVRDSTLNSTNDYQTFVEPFVGWCQPGHDVILLDEVVVCSSGATGSTITLGC